MRKGGDTSEDSATPQTVVSAEMNMALGMIFLSCLTRKRESQWFCYVFLKFDIK